MCRGADVEGLGRLRLYSWSLSELEGKQAQDAAMTTIGVYRLGCRTRTQTAHWGLCPWSPDKRLVPTGPEKHKGKPLPSDAGQPWGS